MKCCYSITQLLLPHLIQIHAFMELNHYILHEFLVYKKRILVFQQAIYQKKEYFSQRKTTHNKTLMHQVREIQKKGKEGVMSCHLERCLAWRWLNPSLLTNSTSDYAITLEHKKQIKKSIWKHVKICMYILLEISYY